MMRDHAAATLRGIRVQIDMLAESAEAGEIGLPEVERHLLPLRQQILALAEPWSDHLPPRDLERIKSILLDPAGSRL
jgi:hypothetical protein